MVQNISTTVISQASGICKLDYFILLAWQGKCSKWYANYG